MKSSNPLLHTPLILQALIWPATRPFLRFFLNLQIKNLSNLTPLSPGVIFVSNHSSELDPIILPASLPFLSKFMPMFYVSRPRSFYKRSSWRKYFYGGWLFKIWGAHPVVGGTKDYSVSLKNHLEILRHGKSVLIFPEGKRTLDGNIMVNEAHGGAAFLSEQSGMPIVPIKMSGLFKMSLGDLFLRKRIASIEFGCPIYVSDIIDRISSENPYKAAMVSVMKIIENMGTADVRDVSKALPVTSPLNISIPKH
jgi:1-acyl-sn-glycerol-3-phosphate acyltransferase